MIHKPAALSDNGHFCSAADKPFYFAAKASQSILAGYKIKFQIAYTILQNNYQFPDHFCFQPQDYLFE